MEASTVNEGFFTEARSLFEEIVAWLGSDVVCGLEHEQLEKNLFVNGNELLRRLLQGYLNTRSDDEIEGDCQGADAEKRTHKRKQERKLTTRFGTVIVSRIGYGQRKIVSLKPLDAELNL
ncbi:MAG: ISKra4 family transposase, partial [Nostoc sp.]